MTQKKRYIGFCKHHSVKLTFKAATKGHHCIKQVSHCPYFTKDIPETPKNVIPFDEFKKLYPPSRGGGIPEAP